MKNEIEAMITDITAKFIGRTRLLDMSGRGGRDRKSTRLNSSHLKLSRMPSSA